MTAKTRPNNLPFHRPPALSTRGSATELYVSPDFTSPSPRASSVPETPTTFDYPPTTSTEAQLSQSPAASTVAIPIMATSSASQPAAAPFATPVIIDSSFAPSVFRGLPSDDAEMWLASFEKYANFRHMTPENKLTFLPVLMKDSASDWYDTLTEEVRTNWQLLHDRFKERFADSDVMKWQKASKLWSRDQGQYESVDAFVTALQKIAKSAAVNDEMLRYAIMRGLRKELRSHVIQSGATSLNDLISAARVAEIATAENTTSSTPSEGLLNQLLQEMSANRRVSEQNAAELQRLARSTAAVNTLGASSTRPAPTRRVSFRAQDIRQGTPPAEQYGNRNGRPGYQSRLPSSRVPLRRGSPPDPSLNNRPSRPTHTCGNCGGMHEFGISNCRAYGVICYTCGKRNHLAKMCRSGKRPSQGALQNF